MSETVEILRKAKALITDGWCRHAFARDKRGKAVEPLSDEATRFCAIGALERAAGGWSWGFERACTSLHQACPSDATSTNDHAPKRFILAAFDRAIAAAEKANA